MKYIIPGKVRIGKYDEACPWAQKDSMKAIEL